MRELRVFDGVALFGPFDGGATSPDVDLPQGRLELLTASALVSLHFGPGISV